MRLTIVGLQLSVENQLSWGMLTFMYVHNSPISPYRTR